MPNPNTLTNTAVSHSGEVDSLLIEKFTGKVHEQYLKGENIMSMFELQEVKGTNMVSNKYFGTTEVQVLAPGQSPKATDTRFDKNALVVDTTVIARNTVAQIHDVQNDIDGHKSKIAENHAKQLLKLEDYMLVQQLLLGGFFNFKARDGVTGGRNAPRIPGHGFSVCIRGYYESLMSSPEYLMGAIEEALEQQIEQEVDVEDLVCLMPYRAFNCLRDAERIVDTTYTDSTGTSKAGFVLKSWNLRIQPSNRFPTAAQVAMTAAGEHHKLSNVDNGYRYDPLAGMDKAVAVIFNSEALLVGRTLEMQSDIFYEKREKTWYIDTWMAEGAIPDRWESVSVVRGFDTATDAKDDAILVQRAQRKATSTKQVIGPAA